MTSRINFTKYLSMSIDQLLFARANLLEEIAELQGEVAMMRGNERAAKLEAYFGTEGTEKYRDNMAMRNALHITQSIWETESKITGLTLEEEFIKDVTNAR